jgi:hypothetical protein
MTLINKVIVTQLSLLSALAFTSCNKAQIDEVKNTKQNLPVLSFKETSFNFGKIQSGDTVAHIFKFTNTGKSPLVINDISASCGCTAAEWPKYPIAPNQAAQIKITFSKRHDPGFHQKTAIIKANTEDPYTVLRIQAIIES